MRNIAFTLVGLSGIITVIIGLLFLFTPMQMAAEFAIEPVGIQGMATIRADFSSYFLTAGGLVLLGLWTKRYELFYINIALYGLTFLGRAFSLIADGVVETAFAPMIVEAGTIILLLWGKKVLSKG